MSRYLNFLSFLLSKKEKLFIFSSLAFSYAMFMLYFLLILLMIYLNVFFQSMSLMN